MIKINGCTPTCVGLQRIILIYYLHADKSEMTAKIDDKSCYVYSKDMYSENVENLNIFLHVKVLHYSILNPHSIFELKLELHQK